MFAVSFDGFDADEEVFGDFGVVHAFADAAEDLELAVGEGVDGVLVFLVLVAHEAGEDLGGAAVAEVDVAGEDLADGGDEVGGGLIFHEVAAGAGAEGAFGVDALVEDGKDKDGDGGVALLELLGEFEAVGAVEGDVDDADVGGELIDLSDGVVGVVGFAADDHVFLVFHEGGEAAADDGMIFNEQDAPGGVLLCRWRVRRFVQRLVRLRCCFELNR